MDEELPPAAAAPPPVPSRLSGLWVLFSKPKLPAWPILIWEGIQWIPDWKSRVDFWIGIAKSTGGFWGGIASVISLPYANLGLTAVALLWLAIAGEPKKGVQRHVWLPYLGWAVFGIITAAVGSALIGGYFEFRVQQEVAKRDVQLQEQSAVRPVFWHLTDAQKNALAFELDKVPEDERFPVHIKCLPDAGSRTFVEEIAKVFLDKKWKVDANCFLPTFDQTSLVWSLVFQKLILESRSVIYPKISRSL